MKNDVIKHNVDNFTFFLKTCKISDFYQIFKQSIYDKTKIMQQNATKLYEENYFQ